MAERLSNLEIVDRVVRDMVSTVRRPTPKIKESKLEFSPIGIQEADVPMFSTTPTSPICSFDDGLSTQRHADVLVP